MASGPSIHRPSCGRHIAGTHDRTPKHRAPELCAVADWATSALVESAIDLALLTPTGPSRQWSRCVHQRVAPSGGATLTEPKIR